MKRIFLITLAAVLITSCSGGSQPSNSSPSVNSQSGASSSDGKADAIQESKNIIQSMGFSDVQIIDAYDLNNSQLAKKWASSENVDGVWCVTFKGNHKDQKNIKWFGLAFQKEDKWFMDGAAPIPPDEDSISFCKHYESIQP